MIATYYSKTSLVVLLFCTASIEVLEFMLSGNSIAALASKCYTLILSEGFLILSMYSQYSLPPKDMHWNEGNMH